MATAIDFKALMRAERQRMRSAVQGTDTEQGPLTEKAAPKQRSSSTELPSHRSAAVSDANNAPLYQLLTRADRSVFDATAHGVSCGLANVAHTAEWVTPAEEAELIACIDRAPLESWTALRGRRLQCLGGLPRPPPDTMTREPLPTWVVSVCDELVRCGYFPPECPPNHVLLNEYQPGQGIDAHKDGPLYAPHVAILSLGSHATFQFVEDTTARSPLASLLLPPRGVLVFTGDAYEHALHTVPADEADDCARPGLIRLDAATAPVEPSGTLAPRTRRLSLTVRHVLHSRTPEEQREVKPSLAEPLPLWEERYRLSRWLG